MARLLRFLVAFDHEDSGLAANTPPTVEPAPAAVVLTACTTSLWLSPLDGATLVPSSWAARGTRICDGSGSNALPGRVSSARVSQCLHASDACLHCIIFLPRAAIESHSKSECAVHFENCMFMSTLHVIQSHAEIATNPFPSGNWSFWVQMTGTSPTGSSGPYDDRVLLTTFALLHRECHSLRRNTAPKSVFPCPRRAASLGTRRPPCVPRILSPVEPLLPIFTLQAGADAAA
jgi:hypothetical protein